MTTPAEPTISRALITGASGGLGAALAQRYAARGVEVWLVARRADHLAAQVAAIRAAGGRAHALQLDVSDADATFELLSRLDAETGGIDLVIANAGVAGARAAIPFARAGWPNTSEILRVNLFGAVASLAPFVPGMLRRGYGQLVGISSIAAEFPNPRTPVYGAAKAGLSFLLKSIDMELRPHGIAVTVVEPGFVRTPAVEGVSEPLPFMLETAAAVAIIERAIRKRRRIVRFPWQWTLLLQLVASLPVALAGPLVRRLSAERVDSPPSAA
jgi:short-subunit dehydrogenase